jgi:hypothetical protein
MKRPIIILCLVVSTSIAHAESMPKASPSSSQENAANTSITGDWEVGFELAGFVVGSFIDKPSASQKIATLGTTKAQYPYPGFAGVGGGGGLTINALWKGVIGVQLGLWNAQESASGTLDIYDYTRPGASGTKHEMTFSKSSWHLPVLLKLAAPTKTVRPFLVVGGDFIFPSTSDLDTTYLGASADDQSYSAFHFGFGLDFLMDIDGVDVRIPLNFRGNYNTGLGDTVDDRVDFSGCSVGMGNTVGCSGYSYRTDWQYQAFVSLGIAVYLK